MQLDFVDEHKCRALIQFGFRILEGKSPCQIRRENKKRLLATRYRVKRKFKLMLSDIQYSLIAPFRQSRPDRPKALHLAKQISYYVEVGIGVVQIPTVLGFPRLVPLLLEEPFLECGYGRQAGIEVIDPLADRRGRNGIADPVLTVIDNRRRCIRPLLKQQLTQLTCRASEMTLLTNGFQGNPSIIRQRQTNISLGDLGSLTDGTRLEVE